MTAEQLQQLGRLWQQRLGLAAWDIDITPVDAEPNGEPIDEHTWMRVIRHRAYERGVVFVATHLLDDGPPRPAGWADVQPDDRRVEVTLVHELLHCWAGPLADGCDDLDGYLSAGVLERTQAHMADVEEHIVDTLARALVDAFAQVPARPADNTVTCSAGPSPTSPA